ncbi:MAG: CocE/NonD family hydrolase [Candidatus Thermoplasmatota archaeon]
MYARPFLVALTLLTLLAGCVTPVATPPSVQAALYEPLTSATHKLGQFLPFDVKSFDGTMIHVDLQLPDGDGPFPTMLEYTPYALLGDEAWGLSAQTNLGLQGYSLANQYVPYGYAVGVVHVRGTGESGGCLTVGGPEEGKDGYAVVEHVAQQKWSNGKVALLGTSYVGTTPIETAITQPPHLSAIIPMSGVTEWYRYYFELGTHRRNGDPFPGSSDTDPALWAAMGMVPGARNPTNGGPDQAQCAAQYTTEDYAQDDYDAYWHARDLTKDAQNITVPVLYAHGWEDWNVAPSVVPAFLVNLTNSSDVHVWLQQHGHGVPASKKAFYEYMHRFLDHWLLDRNNGAELLPTVIVEDNTGKFRAEPSWPPANLTSTRFYPVTGWKLAAAQGSGALSYHDDATGRIDAELVGVDHLAFVSAPLDAPLHIAGVPRLHVKLASDMPGTQIDVLVYDRAPDGSQAYLSRGYLDARHRDSLDKGADMIAGQAYDINFDLHPNDHIVAKGHSVVLVIKSTDDYVMRSPYRATNTVTLGNGTYLELPMIDDGMIAHADAPPAPWVN